jgi:DNA-binding protein HU-beta
VNKSQLIDALSQHYEGNKKSAQHALESVLDTITREVAKGEKVAITGFGAFEKVIRPARMVRNPQTGERKRAKKTAVPKFRPGADLKNVVSGAKKLPKLAKATATTATAAATATAAKATPAKKTSTAKATAAKKSAAKKSTAKKSAAKKSTAKKSTAKKAPAKKTSTAAKKSPAKKSTAKKSTAKKAPAKKATAKKATTAKKSTAKKTAKTAKKR